MKIRPSIFGFVGIIAVLIVLVLWHGKKKTEATPPAVLSGMTLPQVSIATNPPVHFNTQNPQVSNSVPSQPLTPQAQEQQMRQEFTELNDIPIVFYGKVEDQSGNAVANATVNFGVRVKNGYESTVKSGQTISDTNGFFTISGYKGESLGLGVKKSGYVLVSMNGSGIYSHLWPESQRAHPDPNNPTVIKMWKLQGAEPLVDISKEYKLPFTGVPINFDLVARKVVPNGGDLEVVITRASGSLSKKNPADWSIQLKPVNGGIIETDYHISQVTYEAPADNYQDDYSVQMRKDDPAWYDNVHKVFFLKSRDGQVYAKLNFNFMINHEPDGLISLQFEGIANTNNSRNWEATVPHEP